MSVTGCIRLARPHVPFIIMASTRGEKELRTDWDEFENVGKQVRLLPEGIEGIKTIVLSKDKELM